MVIVDELRGASCAPWLALQIVRLRGWNVRSRDDRVTWVENWLKKVAVLRWLGLGTGAVGGQRRGSCGSCCDGSGLIETWVLVEAFDVGE